MPQGSGPIKLFNDGPSALVRMVETHVLAGKCRKKRVVTNRHCGSYGLDALADVALVVDRSTTRILALNAPVFDELGLCHSGLVGTPIGDLGVINGRTIDDLFSDDGPQVYFDWHLPATDGGLRAYNFAFRLTAGSTRVLLVGRPLDALAHSHSQLAALQQLADLTDDIFVVTDRVGFVTYANAAAARTHGAQEFTGRHVSEFVHEDDEGFEDLVEAVINQHPRAEARVLAHRANGDKVPLEVRMVFHPPSQRWFTIERDITAVVEQERHMATLAADLHHRATHDELTGVANRSALNDRLADAIASDHPFALLLLDMDEFKSVNDTFGHAAGDELLREVASRITSAAHPDALVARLGGDEFVVLMPNIEDADSAALVAGRIIDVVGEPFAVGDEEVVRSCSIGIALRGSEDDASAVLRKADRAVYKAKRAGRGRFALHR